jgi:hypothetical protein
MFENMSIPKLNPSDPDFYIEEFWYSFKYSIISFYNLIKKEQHDQIKLWSENLNKLKSEKNYQQIENSIRNYMSEFANDLFKFSSPETLYYDQIFLTNINRWNKISKQFNFENSPRYSKILYLFMIFIEIKEMIHKGKLQKEEIEIISNLNDQTNSYDNLIKLAINCSKAKILDLLKKIPDYDLLNEIRRLYPNINFDNSIKMLKLCGLIKNYKI